MAQLDIAALNGHIRPRFKSPLSRLELPCSHLFGLDPGAGLQFKSAEIARKRQTAQGACFPVAENVDTGVALSHGSSKGIDHAGVFVLDRRHAPKGVVGSSDAFGEFLFGDAHDLSRPGALFGGLVDREPVLPCVPGSEKVFIGFDDTCGPAAP